MNLRLHKVRQVAHIYEHEKGPFATSEVSIESLLPTNNFIEDGKMKLAALA